jgi:MGT family glycosyltransferase
VVYVSLGTLFNVNAAFYRACFEAFENADVQVVLSIGPTVPTDSLGPRPANVILAPHVPQIEILDRASAFVTHGGMNSVSEALFHGVPLVVIPQMSEQEIVGRRVEELGAGVYLDRRDASPARLRAAVDRVLAGDNFRRGAAAVGASLRAAGGVPAAAEAVRSFAAARDLAAATAG